MTANMSVATTDERTLPIQQMDPNDISLLDDMQAAPIDIMSDYWSPEKIGESKKVLFDRIEATQVIDQKSGEVMDMDCAFFFVREPGSNRVKRIRNGSKKLVAAFSNIPQRTPWEITYTGKEKNKTNSNMSDSWSVQPLMTKNESAK